MCFDFVLNAGYSIPIGNFSASIGTNLTYGTGFLNGQSGFEGRVSTRASFYDGNFGLSYGINSFYGKNPQKTAMYGLRNGRFSMNYENDSELNKGFSDEWRTAALSVGWENYSIGLII